jgi:hypothetical protein
MSHPTYVFIKGQMIACSNGAASAAHKICYCGLDVPATTLLRDFENKLSGLVHVRSRKWAESIWSQSQRYLTMERWRNQLSRLV